MLSTLRLNFISKNRLFFSLKINLEKLIHGANSLVKFNHEFHTNLNDYRIF